MDEHIERTRAGEVDLVDWWSVDREILACLANHAAMTPAEISRRLGLPEGEVTCLLSMLAQEGGASWIARGSSLALSLGLSGNGLTLHLPLAHPRRGFRGEFPGGDADK